MKKLLLLLSILLPAICHAQNYNCLQFGPKNYFTNGDGYLRGMRIDSVRNTGADTVYYPYQTTRMGGYSDFCGFARSVDSLGGSWLGKKVICQTDGTWLFDNMWHDTTIIKTQANLGDTWIFYNDATNVHYTATVSAVDTMTVLGTSDSIKTITITVDSAGIPKLNDPVNNFQMKISKDHGFVQVFDLYTFPYHMPDSLSNICYLDYYLDIVIGRNSGYGEGMHTPIRGPYPNTSNSIFNLISFHNPTRKEMFDFVAGDVYEYTVTMPVASTVWLETNYIDTISSAVHTPFYSNYVIADHYTQITHSPSPPTYMHHDNVNGGSYDTTSFINPDLMPEEKRSQYYYHYFPDKGPLDSSFCNIHGQYVLNGDNIIYGDSIYIMYVHGDDFGVQQLPAYAAIYYIGYGLFNSSQTSVNYDKEQYMTYFYKNGVVCYGYFRWLDGIKNINDPITQLQLIPNPANNQLTIKTNITGAYTIVITNILGQVVAELNASSLEEKVNISNIQNGMYSMTLTDNYGNRITQKLVVAH